MATRQRLSFSHFVSRRPLLQALGFSLLAHATLLAWPNVAPTPLPEGHLVSVTLRAPALASPLAAQDTHPVAESDAPPPVPPPAPTTKPAPPAKPPLPARTTPPMPLASHAETVFNLAPPSPAPRETANQDEIAAAYPAGAATSPEAGHPNPAGIPQPGRAATQGEAPPDDPSSDALRDYRFALARAAQAYKRYPTLARERGQEGTAQVRLIWKRGVVQFVLQKTSGHPLLDEAALTMLRQAISHTPLPKTLQDTPFSLDLPIEYSLNPP